VGLRLVAQWLLTTRLDNSGTLEAAIAPTDLGATLTRRRAASLAAVARSVGRLHGLGWFHGDLYPRNLLLVGPGSQVEAAVIDLWRGGPLPRPRARRLPARWLRAFARDLGCFFLHGALWLLPGEQRAFLARYLASLGEALESRGLSGPKRADLLRAVAAARAAERERFAADPRRQAGRPMPPALWTPPPASELDWPLRSPGQG
jgi:Ser/Thr protein kinase RdoA (MazF antagonist)